MPNDLVTATETPAPADALSVKPLSWTEANPASFEIKRADTMVGRFAIERRFLDGQFFVRLPPALAQHFGEEIDCASPEDGEQKVQDVLLAVVSELVAK